MQVVAIHIGEQLPSYFYDCMEQVRRNFGGKIHVIIPRKNVVNNAIKRISLHPVAYERLIGHRLYREFEKACFLDGFWNVTMGRLFLLEILMHQKQLRDVVHLENDVLIYRNPEDMIDEFKSLARGAVALTPIGDNYISAAYMFAQNHIAVSKVNTTLLGLMKKGRKEVTRLVGQGPNEMMMLSYIWKKYDHLIKLLPVQPEGKGGRSFGLFRGVFDPASFGQYLGGTQSDPPGWYGQNHHWIGKALHQGKYKFEWITENGIKKPVLVYGKKKCRIYNLHIHSKNLKGFM